MGCVSLQFESSGSWSSTFVPCELFFRRLWGLTGSGMSRAAAAAGAVVSSNPVGVGSPGGKSGQLAGVVSAMPALGAAAADIGGSGGGKSRKGDNSETIQVKWT
jgi:hypothetical protein